MVLFLALPLACFSQNIEITGKIIDQETRQALPFASLQIEKTSVGTNANGEGHFQLIVPQAFVNRNLLVSYIGYSTQKIQMSTLSRSSVIQLKAVAHELREVVIMPDSSLMVFLQQAFANIKNNYTNRPYELEGFYRESLKTEAGKYIYFGEAQLLLQGSGYQFSKEPGTVKILKSRVNHFPQSDTATSVGYYGGPFSGIAGDIVKRKPSWLKPDKKNYTYELLDMTTHDGKEVWIIGFTKKDGDIEGKLFIEKGSKAYVRTDVIRHSADSSDLISLSRVHTIKSVDHTLYNKVGDTWFLQYRDHQKVQFNKQLKENTSVITEFSVSKIVTDSISYIPFNQRLGYTEVFSRLENNFAEDFWQGTTTLVPDSILQSQLTPYQSQEKRNELINYVSPEIKPSPKPIQSHKITRFISRFGFSVGTQFLPYAVNDSHFLLTYPSTSSALSFEKTVNGVGVPLLLATDFSFRLNNRWRVFTSHAGGFSSQYDFKSRAFGVRYTLQLNRRGSPLMLRPSAEFGSQNFAINFPVFNNTEGIEFDGKHIETEELRFQVGERMKYILPALSLEKKLSGLKWVYLSAGYYLILQKQNRLYLKDESGFFLFRSTRSEPLNGSGATVLINNQPMPDEVNWFKNLYINVGLRFLFN
jgi:hypothetical protein